ncbi:hypothetical protein GM50_11910 [freshwater metagenome]|uniref:Uncharacterized protein n=1 Tax=freshwater metagenome TaxID=449393 RepID=A0A094PZW9_9ZZZZ
MNQSLISNALTFFKFTGIASSFFLVGTLLALTFLTQNLAGKVNDENYRLRRFAQSSALIWVLSNVAFIVLTLADILAVDLQSALATNVLKSLHSYFCH